jgi:flagellar protein FliL
METENQTKSSPRGAKFLGIVLLLAGLVVGGGSGAVIASMLQSSSAAAATPRAKPGADGAGAEEEEDEEEEYAREARATPRPIYMIEDMVLNPAGSQGTRFLMVTVAIEVKDSQAASTLAARDAQVRDRILGVLAAKSVPELVAPDSARAALRVEIRDSTARLFPRGTVRRVFLPKFVIQ